MATKAELQKCLDKSRARVEELDQKWREQEQKIAELSNKKILIEIRQKEDERCYSMRVKEIGQAAETIQKLNTEVSDLNKVISGMLKDKYLNND